MKETIKKELIVPGSAINTAMVAQGFPPAQPPSEMVEGSVVNRDNNLRDVDMMDI